MNHLSPSLLALLLFLAATPASAFECENTGTLAAFLPDDFGNSSATACGPSAEADGLGSVALGDSANSNGESSIAVGEDANAPAAGGIALGWETQATGGSATAVGRSVIASGTSSIALGYLAFAGGISSTALGHFAAATGSYGAAFGYNAKASSDTSTALGSGAFADQPNTVILGSIPGVNSASFYANVGIGTHTPTESVDVQRTAAAARFQLSSHTATATEAPQFIQRRARGTAAAPTAVLNNDNLGLFSFRGHNGTAMGGSRATITAQAAGNFTSVSTPTRLIFATTPVGQTTPQQVLVITPDGKVQVNGQNLSVPDYVFEDDYALMPLDELRAFIDANGHLPGIASADQVQAEGLDLAGSQLGLLQKVEELTLYTLQQQEHIDRLEAMVVQLMQDRSGP